MIKIKQSKLVLIKGLILILSLIACKKNQTNTSDEVYNTYNWKKGKTTFYNNCAPCHKPIDKDELFHSFNSQLKEQILNEKIIIFKKVLSNEKHLNNIDKDSLTKKSIEDLLLYIETPLPSRVKN